MSVCANEVNFFLNTRASKIPELFENVNLQTPNCQPQLARLIFWLATPPNKNLDRSLSVV